MDRRPNAVVIFARARNNASTDAPGDGSASLLWPTSGLAVMPRSPAMGEASPEVHQLPVDLRVADAPSRNLGHQDQVLVCREQLLVLAPHLTDQSLDAVSFDRTTNLLAHRNPHPPLTSRGADKGQQVPQVNFSAAPLYREKLPSLPQSVRLEQTLGIPFAGGGHGRRQEASLLGDGHCQPGTPLGSASVDQLASPARPHAAAKPVNPTSAFIMRLVRPLHCSTPSKKSVFDISVRCGCQASRSPAAHDNHLLPRGWILSVFNRIL